MKEVINSWSDWIHNEMVRQDAIEDYRDNIAKEEGYEDRGDFEEDQGDEWRERGVDEDKIFHYDRHGQ